MQRRIRIAAFACTCLLLVVPAAQAGMEVNINFAIGGKSLDEDDWGDADGQGLFGVATTFGKPDWPVAIALDYLGSGKSESVLVLQPVIAEVDLFQVTTEFDAGVRKIWKAGKARPFVGGGFGIRGELYPEE